MFAVVLQEENKNKRGIFKKRKCKIEATQVAVKGGAPFRLIKAVTGTDGVNWREIALQAGCCSQSVVLSHGLNIPETAQLKPFVPKTLPLLCLMNTAVAQMGTGDEAKTRQLLIVDKSAVLPDYIDRVALVAAKIKIITDYPEKYYEAARRLMERFGAAITVAAGRTDDEEYCAAVSMKKIPGCVNCFCLENVDFENRVKIPPEYLRICPPGVELFLFACALFECCGVRALGDMHF